jgi:hypothetical protein
MCYHHLQGRAAVHDGGAAILTNYDFGDQNARVGENQDLTPDMATAVVEAEAAHAKLAMHVVKGGDDAPSWQDGATPPPEEPSTKPALAWYKRGQGESRLRTN